MLLAGDNLQTMGCGAGVPAQGPGTGAGTAQGGGKGARRSSPPPRQTKSGQAWGAGGLPATWGARGVSPAGAGALSDSATAALGEPGQEGGRARGCRGQGAGGSESPSWMQMAGPGVQEPGTPKAGTGRPSAPRSFQALGANTHRVRGSLELERPLAPGPSTQRFTKARPGGARAAGGSPRSAALGGGACVLLRVPGIPERLQLGPRNRGSFQEVPAQPRTLGSPGVPKGGGSRGDQGPGQARLPTCHWGQSPPPTQHGSLGVAWTRGTKPVTRGPPKELPPFQHPLWHIYGEPQARPPEPPANFWRSFRDPRCTPERTAGASPGSGQRL